jgi:hypothetical protein
MAGIESIREWPRDNQTLVDCLRWSTMLREGASERPLQVRSLTAGAGLPWPPLTGLNSANPAHDATLAAGNSYRTPPCTAPPPALGWP